MITLFGKASGLYPPIESGLHLVPMTHDGGVFTTAPKPDQSHRSQSSLASNMETCDRAADSTQD